MVCVYFISPVGTEMKKISQAEKKTYKRKIKFIVFFNVIIAIINVLSGAYEFVFSLMFVYNTKCNGVNGNNKKYKVLFQKKWNIRKIRKIKKDIVEKYM